MVSSTAADPSTAGFHSVHGQRLRRTMQNFDAATRDRIPADTDLYDRWSGVFPDMAEAARDVRTSAQAMAASPPPELDGERRASFVTMAADLENAAADLEEAAGRSDADATAELRNRMTESCSSCHALFRPAVAGTPEPMR